MRRTGATTALTRNQGTMLPFMTSRQNVKGKRDTSWDSTRVVVVLRTLVKLITTQSVAAKLVLCCVAVAVLSVWLLLGRLPLLCGSNSDSNGGGVLNRISTALWCSRDQGSASQSAGGPPTAATPPPPSPTLLDLGTSNDPLDSAHVSPVLPVQSAGGVSSLAPVDLNGYKVMTGAQNAQDFSNFERGISRYVRTLSLHLLRMAPHVMHSVDFSHMYGLPEASVMNKFLELGNVTVASLFHPTEHPLSKERILYHVMSPFIGFDKPLDGIVPQVIQRSAHAKLVCTVHDLIPLIFKDQYLKDPSMLHIYTQRLEFLGRCDAIVAISQTTKEDVMKHLNYPEERIFVVQEGAHSHFAPLPLSEKKRRHSFELLRRAVPGIRGGGFLMYVGGSDFRKNENRLIQAYGMLPAHMRDERQLVLVSKKSEAEVEALRKYFRENVPGFKEDQLVITNYIDEDTLVRLYQFCGLFVFPSIYEGFGLPVIEAIQSGALVAASGTSSTRELVPYAELQFDPMDTKSISDRIRAVLEMPEERTEWLKRQLRQSLATYNWRSATERMLQVYAQVARLPRWTTASAPLKTATSAGTVSRVQSTSGDLRIAVFTPWPAATAPAAAVAEYSFDFVTAMAEILSDPRHPMKQQQQQQHSAMDKGGDIRGIQVDVYVDSGGDVSLEGLQSVPPSLMSSVRLLDHSRFRFEHSMMPYQEILYVMSNSRDHAYMLPYTHQFPGSVMMHDARLEQVYLAHVQRQFPGDRQKQNDEMRSTIMRMDGRMELFQDIPQSVLDSDGRLSSEMASGTLQQSTFMNQEVVSSATRVFVFSEFTRRMLSLRNPAAVDQKVHVTPFGHRDPGARFHVARQRMLQPDQGLRPIRPGSELVPTVPRITIAAPYGDEGEHDIVRVMEACALLEMKRQEAITPSRIPPFRLVMVGNGRPGVNMDELPQSVRGIFESVKPASNRSFNSWMAKSHVVVLLDTADGASQTHAERWSSIAADCMSAGIPIVMSRRGVSSEIDPDAALFVAPDISSVRLMQTLEQLLIDGQLRDRLSAAALRYSSQHSLAASVHAYLEHARLLAHS